MVCLQKIIPPSTLNAYSTKASIKLWSLTTDVSIHLPTTQNPFGLSIQTTLHSKFSTRAIDLVWFAEWTWRIAQISLRVNASSFATNP